MPEIIPNLHPAAVHLPIALTLIALVFNLGARLVKNRSSASQWSVVGHWSIRIAGITAVIAVALGLQAYNSVNHDEAGHVAMLLHRNWAVPTAIGLVLLATWDSWKYKAESLLPIPALLLLIVLSFSITATAWLGGELVYRHGIGVSALPEPEAGEGGEHHHHDHEHHHEADESMHMDHDAATPAMVSPHPN